MQRGRYDILAVADAASGATFRNTAGLIKNAKIHGLALAPTGNKDDLAVEATSNDFRPAEFRRIRHSAKNVNAPAQCGAVK